MNKRRLSTVILIVVIITGLSLLLYPTVSDYFNSLGYRKTIEEYQSKVDEIDSDTYKQILNSARQYNKELAKKFTTLSVLTDEEKKEYESQLDITGTGIMCYIEIESIDILLPVYHGVSDAVLQSGIGHIEGSSLPVGGKSTHTVFSGHRGLPSSKLFSNIDRLKYGDTFTVCVLNEKLTYEVDRILTVEPDNLKSLKIEKGKDYCTLMTCTPYGVNTHRLLIRGHRIKTPVKSDIEQNIWKLLNINIIIPVAVIAIVLIFILLAVRRRKNRR